jgi:mevalonate kinase
MKKAQTEPMVKRVAKFKTSNPKEANRILGEMDRVAREGLEALKRGDLENLGRAMNRNQELLKELKVSHPKLDRLIDAALKNGALAAKLSGGGGGGIMIALCETEAEQKKVAAAINKVGGKAVRAKMGVPGLRVREV